MAPTSRLEALRDNIAARLRPLCFDWPEQQFAEMVDHIAEITLKYEGRGSSAIHDFPYPDGLMTNLQDGLKRSEAARARPNSLAKGMGSIPHASNRSGVPPRRPESNGS